MYKTLFLILIFAGSTALITAQKNEEISINDDIQLIRLEDSLFIHISWHSSEPYGRFPSNGMILIKNGKALMIDTPFDIEKTKLLTSFIEDSLHAKLETFIAGHYHDDNIGGLQYLHDQSVQSLANVLTVEKCKELSLAVPKIAFKDSMHLNFEGEELILLYFGPGHTVDNSIVRFPERKILFGGCLIKSGNSTNLGNTADAYISEWDKTVEKILTAYPDVKTVIPGHGQYGGKELLTHTIELVKTYKNEHHK